MRIRVRNGRPPPALGFGPRATLVRFRSLAQSVDGSWTKVEQGLLQQAAHQPDRKLGEVRIAWLSEGRCRNRLPMTVSFGRLG